jgi:carbon monoxide dehydrogenase subunit G
MDPVTTINHTALISVDPEAVWHLLRQFGVIDAWHPQIDSCVIEGGKYSGDGGSIRTLHLLGSKVVHERLLAIDNDRMTMTYGLTDPGIPLDHFCATVGVTPAGDGVQSTVNWTARFEARDATVAAEYESLIGEFILNGLDGLADHLGAPMELETCA